MQLMHFGWNSDWEEKFKPFEDKNYTVGRVILEHTHLYKVYTNNGELQAEVSGRIRGKAEGRLGRRDEFPAVGDWVLLREFPEEKKAVIHGILPRQSKFSRKVAGKGAYEQIVAANIDIVFIVSSLNNEFNLRRIERFLALAWESGAMPVIILTKADLCPDVTLKTTEVESIATGVPVHVVSSLQGIGLESLKTYFSKRQTVGILGSSGVGKSTLINSFLDEETLRVNEVRENDDKGKHTTTHRQLVILPSGGLVIDTPGMRELQVWEIDDGLKNLYGDIIQISSKCRFNDCLHNNEPGCAVRQAIEKGTLQLDRLNNYNKMQKEAAEHSLQMLGSLGIVEKKKGKRYAQILRDEYKKREKRKNRP